MPEYDPQEEQLIRKLDKKLIPLLALLYLASLVDRGTLFHARVTNHATASGLKHDLGVSDDAYVVALVVYGIASVLLVFPSTFGLRMFGPARWLAGIVAGWGFLAACSAATSTLAGWVVVQILMGALQAGFLPGILLYILSFYTREEWASRMSWVVSSGTVATSFFGIFVDWGSQFDGAKGLQTWKWMFVCSGLFSIVIGAVTVMFLPDYPQTCAFLTPADRVLAVARGHDGSEGGVHESEEEETQRRKSVTPRLKGPRVRFDSGQLIEALTDKRNWLFAFAFCFISVAMDALISVGPEVTATSFSLTTQFLETHEKDPNAVENAIEAADGTRQARIFAAIPYLIGGIVAPIFSWNSDRTGDRALHATLPLMASSLGFALLAFVPVTLAHAGPVRYFLGLLPATAGVVAAYPCLLAYALDKAQGDTSRVAVAAITFSIGQAFSPAISSPGSVLLRDSTAPTGHAVGLGVCACGVALSAASVLLIRWLYRGDETQMWGKGPALRRLLNDEDEDKAWGVELSQADMFGSISGKGKKPRKASGFWSDRRDSNAGSDWDLKEYASTK
ncbi:major facilitator superfamily domain-containing protein [Fimicolochytrium jonesii]|uniref:major facilitator superfamily domain-containing protein n=1 Tax=Fimicolochytrium jonesii TaxID=1396493 RepID=UPI0022FE51F6|nr:major facilitator superfamily domain-containing protein [Fimicolochytrium jonesii]KAI8824041.1 major facilitator superfamily domain-containing protein [Fimicolochytrium jonesii]